MYRSFIRLTDEELKSLLETASALSNNVRLHILVMLQKRLRDGAGKYHSLEYYALNVREITDKVQELDGVKDDISEVAIRQHLNDLMDAGLVGRIKKNDVYAFYFNVLAFDTLLFENQFFLEEIQSFMRLYGKTMEHKKEADFVMTVFTGFDKGECLKLNKDQKGYIGRNSCYPKDKYGSESLLLSPSYETVNLRHEPHLEVFYEDGEWFMVDNSTNGTFIYGKAVEKGEPVKLENDSFVQLSRGPKSVVLYVSYN